MNVNVAVKVELESEILIVEGSVFVFLNCSSISFICFLTGDTSKEPVKATERDRRTIQKDKYRPFN